MNNNVHPHLGQNWHARMTELAMALSSGKYRDEDIETDTELAVEADWLIESILYDGENHHLLTPKDENFHARYQYTKLIPAHLDDQDQDRWTSFLEKAIEHFNSLGIPTNQYGSKKAEDGDDYVQTLEKLELKFDPSKAKQATTIKSEVAELKELVVALTEIQMAQAKQSD